MADYFNLWLVRNWISSCDQLTVLVVIDVVCSCVQRSVYIVVLCCFGCVTDDGLIDDGTRVVVDDVHKLALRLSRC